MENTEEAKMIKNKFEGTLKDVDFSELIFPVAVIYNKPKDFPTCFAIRIFDGNKPTNVVFLSTNLEECRKELNKAGFALWCGRDKRDDKCIVETWM